MLVSGDCILLTLEHWSSVAHEVLLSTEHWCGNTSVIE